MSGQEQRRCSVDRCVREPRSRTAELCNSHYFRVRRTGKTGPAEIWDRKVKPCRLFDECGRDGTDGHGLCNLHGQRLRAHGDPTIVWPNVRSGAEHHQWAGDDAGYGAVHERIRATRGPATDYPCRACGLPARWWCYDGKAPDQRPSPNGPYSYHLNHYRPLCGPCQGRYMVGELDDRQFSTSA